MIEEVKIKDVQTLNVVITGYFYIITLVITIM
jgi:hypothetical protein